MQRCHLFRSPRRLLSQTASDSVEDESKQVVEFSADRSRSHGKTYGRGAINVVSPASKAVAPTVPSLWYIAPAKRGKAQPKLDRMKLFPAMADAAIGRYATTKYVNTEVKAKYTPEPKGKAAMIGTIQWTLGYVVKASQ
jgi:hypothetical protein